MKLSRRLHAATGMVSGLDDDEYLNNFSRIPYCVQSL